MAPNENIQKKKFWDLTKQGPREIFSPWELTLLKKVPGGLLLRHLYIRGEFHTRSALLFIPHSHSDLDIDNFEIEWKPLNTERNPNWALFLHRMRLPEGWALKELLSTKSSSNKGTFGLSLTYIPDPENQWQI